MSIRNTLLVLLLVCCTACATSGGSDQKVNRESVLTVEGRLASETYIPINAGVIFKYMTRLDELKWEALESMTPLAYAFDELKTEFKKAAPKERLDLLPALLKAEADLEGANLVIQMLGSRIQEAGQHSRVNPPPESLHFRRFGTWMEYDYAVKEAYKELKATDKSAP